LPSPFSVSSPDKNDFAVFLSALLQDKALTAAVDGKINKQMLDKDGNLLQMLNVFVHDIKIWFDSDNAERAASFDGKNPFAHLRSFFGRVLNLLIPPFLATNCTNFH
jgi:hypothetical protein